MVERMVERMIKRIVTKKRYNKKRKYFTKKRRSIKKIQNKKYKKGGASFDLIELKKILLKDLDAMFENNKTKDNDPNYNKLKKSIEDLSITSTMDKLTNTASDILKNGKDFFDNITKPTKHENKMKIQLYIRPDTSKIYNKQGSNENGAFESGDFFVNIINKDFRLFESIRKNLSSTDSLLANILNRCNDWTCLSSSDPPLIAKQEIDITDNRDKVFKKMKKDKDERTKK
jgi:hypothetical protein